MTKSQKSKVVIDCVAANIQITDDKLIRLDRERKNRKDLDRFIYNSPFRKTTNAAS